MAAATAQRQCHSFFTTCCGVGKYFCSMPSSGLQGVAGARFIKDWAFFDASADFWALPISL